MLKIGVTGGIGSGKSTVCKVFESLGIPVFSADQEAKSCVNENQQVIDAIKITFGDDAYDGEGMLNSQFIAATVFKNPAQLQQLNDIVHPAVRERFKKWVDNQLDCPYVIMEAAILFESGGYRQLDKIITISAPQMIRVNRVIKRDGTTKKEVNNRMARQLDEKERISRADYVIYNDDKQMIIPQVLAIHEKLKAL